MPYAPWCVWCRRGKGRNFNHKTVKRSSTDIEDGTPRIGIDYMSISENWQEKMTPILVVKDTMSKAIMAHAVLRNGAGDKWIVRRLVRDLDDMGYGMIKLAIRSDQEPAVVDVKHAVREESWKEFEAIMEEVKESRSGQTEMIR